MIKIPNTSILLTTKFSSFYTPLFSQLKKFLKNFFIRFPYHDKIVNAINFFDLFELSDFILTMLSIGCMIIENNQLY